MKARTRTRKIVALVLACVLFITYIPIVFASDVVVPPPEENYVDSADPPSSAGTGTGTGTGDNTGTGVGAGETILPPDATYIPSENGAGGGAGNGDGEGAGNGIGNGTGNDTGLPVVTENEVIDPADPVVGASNGASTEGQNGLIIETHSGQSDDKMSGFFALTIQDTNGTIKGGEKLTFTVPDYVRFLSLIHI